MPVGSCIGHCHLLLLPCSYFAVSCVSWSRTEPKQSHTLPTSETTSAPQTFCGVLAALGTRADKVKACNIRFQSGDRLALRSSSQIIWTTAVLFLSSESRHVRTVTPSKGSFEGSGPCTFSWLQHAFVCPTVASCMLHLSVQSSCSDLLPSVH